MAKEFLLSISSLQASRTPAKEKLVGRAMLTRDGMAGSTKKWECYLVDDNRPQSVALIEAWGDRSIKRAKETFQDGQVYEITKFIVEPKGKSIPFANQATKIPFTPSVVVKHLPKEHPNIPSTLPTEDIANIVELQASRVVSLIVEVHEARGKQLRDLKRGQAQK